MAARLPYLDREQVPPDVQAVYDRMKKATGRVLNTFRLMAHQPAPWRRSSRGTGRCARARSASSCASSPT